MKKKKLNALNIIEGGLSSSTALSRSEMKNILGGSCSSGTAQCTCDGVDCGCQTVQGCWDCC